MCGGRRAPLTLSTVRSVPPWVHFRHTSIHFCLSRRSPAPGPFEVCQRSESKCAGVTCRAEAARRALGARPRRPSGRPLRAGNGRHRLGEPRCATASHIACRAASTLRRSMRRLSSPRIAALLLRARYITSLSTRALFISWLRCWVVRATAILDRVVGIILLLQFSAGCSVHSVSGDTNTVVMGSCLLHCCQPNHAGPAREWLLSSVTPDSILLAPPSVASRSGTARPGVDASMLRAAGALTRCARCLPGRCIT